MTDTLKERQEEYESNYRFTITRRMPIIIRVNLRNYKRLTQNLKKPYSEEFAEIMANAMLYTITEIQDAIFGYYYQDEIIFILRNDKKNDYEPWYQNDIQKITSIVSSLMTIGFYRSREVFNEELNISSEGVFSVKIFGMPYIAETINNLIWHQQSCMKFAISCATLKELDNKFGRKTAMKFLQDTTYEEKKELLSQHCGIEFEEYYPKSFIYGVASYKVPTISKNSGDTRNKWTLNYNIPNFLEDKDFLYNILTNGIDVFRANTINN